MYMHGRVDLSCQARDTRGGSSPDILYINNCGGVHVAFLFKKKL